MATAIAQFVTWNNSWLVGVKEIDAQHKNLVAILNQLHEAMTRGQGKDVLGAILASLVNYTKAHFTAEERMMHESGYPDIVAHKYEHQQLTAKVVDFQKKFDSGSIGIGVEVMQFLSAWLQGHIKGTDKKYTPYMHAKGFQ